MSQNQLVLVIDNHIQTVPIQGQSQNTKNRVFRSKKCIVNSGDFSLDRFKIEVSGNEILCLISCCNLYLHFFIFSYSKGKSLNKIRIRNVISYLWIVFAVLVQSQAFKKNLIVLETKKEKVVCHISNSK